MPNRKYLIRHLSSPAEDLNVFSRFIKEAMTINNKKICEYAAMAPSVMIRGCSNIIAWFLVNNKTIRAPEKR